MKATITNKRNLTFTTYTAKNPYKVSDNGVKYFKQLITWDNSRIGRVIYDKPVLIDTTEATYN